MTDIIRMAREAGLSKPWDQEPVERKTLERFAALVAAAEREKYPIGLTHEQYKAVIEAAIRDEREECAKLIERDDSMRWSGAADAIRARGNHAPHPTGS